MGKYFTLTFYEKNLQSGELWIRTPNNTVLPAHEALKNVFIKYKDVDPNIIGEPGYQSFYEQLNTGTRYLRFDIIEDVIFVETQRGCIFDQIVYENNIIYPKTQDNNFMTSYKTKRFGFPSYWFDEHERKIYIASNTISDWAGSETWQENYSGITTKYMIEEFDLETSILDLKCHFDLDIRYAITNVYKELPIVEPVKLSYNNDTKIFNLSHICRGPKKQFGLISINISRDKDLKVKQVNAFLPLQPNIDSPYTMPEIPNQPPISIPIIPKNTIIPTATPPTPTPTPITPQSPTVITNAPNQVQTQPTTNISVNVKPTKP
jgi:hypothetical protein